MMKCRSALVSGKKVFEEVGEEMVAGEGVMDLKCPEPSPEPCPEAGPDPCPEADDWA
jgi:hypothetical protein